MSLKKTLLKTAFLGGCSILGLGIGVSVLDRYEEAHKSKENEGIVDAKFETINREEDEGIHEDEELDEE